MMRKQNNQKVGEFHGPFIAPIGAGGFVLPWDQSADGTDMYHGADVGSGGYRRRTGDPRWYSMFSQQSLTPTELTSVMKDPTIDNDGNGMIAVRVAPSDKNIIYSLWRGRVFKSTDRGLSQRRTNSGFISCAPNSSSLRYCGRMIDVHPTNPDRVLFASTHHATIGYRGFFYTLDGCTTALVKIPGLPDNVSLPGENAGPKQRGLVAYDPGQPDTCYLFVQGTGLYRSDGGEDGPWGLVDGSPLFCTQMVVTANGKVYLACGLGARVGGEDLWTQTRAGVKAGIATGMAEGAHFVAVDPSNFNRIIVSDGWQGYQVTFDGGANWQEHRTWTNNMMIGPGEIEWLSSDPPKPSNFGGGSGLYFDNAVPGKVWQMTGLGVVWFQFPTANGQLIAHDYSQGNEEKVAISFLSIPGNPYPILGNWDYSFWQMRDLKKWTNRGLVPPLDPGNNGLAIANDMDYAIDDPNFIVVAVSQSANSNAYSDDGGRTLKRLPGQVDFPYANGAIAVSNKNNIIIIGSNNADCHYTKDGGATPWKKVQLVPGTNLNNQINALYIPRHCVTSDKTRPGVFAFIGRSDNVKGLWISTDGGDTWDKTREEVGASLADMDLRAFYQSKLEYIPGKTGELLYSHASQDYEPGLSPLVWLKNDGATEEALGVNQGAMHISAYDFGPVAPGQTYPSLAFYGRVDGVLGLYLSFDWFATKPDLIAEHPLENLTGGFVVGCDMNKLGRVFCGGIGWNFFDFGKKMTFKAPA